MLAQNCQKSVWHYPNSRKLSANHWPYVSPIMAQHWSYFYLKLPKQHWWLVQVCQMSACHYLNCSDCQLNIGPTLTFGQCGPNIWQMLIWDNLTSINHQPNVGLMLAQNWRNVGLTLTQVNWLFVRHWPNVGPMTVWHWTIISPTLLDVNLRLPEQDWLSA